MNKAKPPSPSVSDIAIDIIPKGPPVGPPPPNPRASPTCAARGPKAECPPAAADGRRQQGLIGGVNRFHAPRPRLREWQLELSRRAELHAHRFLGQCLRRGLRHASLVRPPVDDRSERIGRFGPEKQARY